MAGTLLSGRDWGEPAGAGSRSIGTQARAQLETLSQAHILLGCPAWGTDREEINNFNQVVNTPDSRAKLDTSLRVDAETRME